MIKTCKQCGKEFELSESEIDFFEEKGLKLPKRCAQCRELNRKQGTTTITPKLKQETEAEPKEVKPSNNKLQGLAIVFIVLLPILTAIVAYLYRPQSSLESIEQLQQQVTGISAMQDVASRIATNTDSIASENQVIEVNQPQIIKSTDSVLIIDGNLINDKKENSNDSTTLKDTEHSHKESMNFVNTRRTIIPNLRRDYVLNTYRKKLHYPDCPSVTQMNQRSRKPFHGTREEALRQGYTPCNNCQP